MPPAERKTAGLFVVALLAAYLVGTSLAQGVSEAQSQADDAASAAEFASHSAAEAADRAEDLESRLEDVESRLGYLSAY